MIKAIFFDLYGTLIDIRTDEYDDSVYETLSRYLSYYSFNIPPDELKKSYFALIQKDMQNSKEKYPEVDVYKIFFSILQGYGRKKCPKYFVTNIALFFRALTLKHFSVFDGSYDVINTIAKKYKIAIISDAQWIFAEPEMSVLGIDQLFNTKILSSKMGFKKPDIRLFTYAMEKFGVKSEESIYIGDNPMKDLKGAKNAGMRFILFGSEYREYNGLYPDRCFYHYSELIGILNEIEK
ncbi:MAG: HAD family hydrolase [Nitrospirae bacterium]|nr:HAD family hydrolase [Nitrospirota bacterium]